MQECKPKIKGFIHVFMVNHWQELLVNQLKLMKKSGLLKASESITVIPIGSNATGYVYDLDNILSRFGRKKFNAFYGYPDGSVGEIITLTEVKCKAAVAKEEEYMFYIHLKGVTSEHICGQPIRDWRNLMEYFVLERWKDCVSALDNGFDICGVNWHENPWPHFSGNFWWAKASYIKSLPPISGYMARDFNIHDRRVKAESWIGKCAEKARVKCLHESGIDSYVTEYPPERYRK